MVPAAPRASCATLTRAEAGHGTARGCLRTGGAGPPRLRLHQLLLVRAARAGARGGREPGGGVRAS